MPITIVIPGLTDTSDRRDPVNWSFPPRWIPGQARDDDGSELKKATPFLASLLHSCWVMTKLKILGGSANKKTPPGLRDSYRAGNNAAVRSDQTISDQPADTGRKL